MVIKFYCRCGKKISVPDDKRYKRGKCPACGMPVSLKDADPAAVERRPLAVVDVDGSAPDAETREFGVVQEREESAVPAGEGTPRIRVSGWNARRKEDRRSGPATTVSRDTDVFQAVKSAGEGGDTETRPLAPAGGGGDAGEARKAGEDERPAELGEDGKDVGARVIHVSGTGERRTFFLKGDVTMVGRGTDVDIVLEERGVSKRHCRLVRREGEYYIEDTGSTNGVFVNGEKVSRARLMKGDKIVLGKAVLFFVV